MTIRELITTIQTEVRDTDLTPNRAAELLTQLSALLGNVNDYVLETELAYNQVLLDLLDSEEKANRAKIKAQVSPEYKAHIQAKNAHELVLELMRALKYFLRGAESELREAKYQMIPGWWPYQPKTEPARENFNIF